MEALGAAAFSVVATAALSKLCTVGGKPSTDADLIRNDFREITAFLQDHAHEGHTSRLRSEYFALLSDLAYDIEDCIDRFHANKTTPEDFAIEIGKLRERSADKERYIDKLGEGAAVVSTEFQDLCDCEWNCLLYLYLFPHNHHVRTKPLTRRWLAERLVNGEEVAVNNLSSIIDKSYVSSIERSSNGKVKWCKPTAQTLQNIAQRSLSKNFILVYDGTAQLPDQGPRRLSVHRANAQLNLPPNLSRHLRTLAVFPAAAAVGGGGTPPPPLASDEAVLDFSKYEKLRVLDLKERGDPLSEEHLHSIFSKDRLVMLRYLSINLGCIGRIPRAIGHLTLLETLDLSGSETVTVYTEVLLLPELKHLLGKFQLSTSDMFSVPILGLFESGLEKFLKNKSKLETLDGFVAGKRYGFPQLMSLMRKLRKVKIWFQPNASKKHLSATSSAITKFIRVGSEQPDIPRSLSIDFQECSGEFFNGIRAVDGRLYSLKLRSKLNGFPPFVAGPITIEELCLCSTRLTWELIRDGLSNVKGLKYVKLIEDNLGRVRIEPADHLKSIQRICVQCETTLEIEIQDVALPNPESPLPNLVSLHILCQNMDVRPGNPGIEIRHMTKLKEVVLHRNVDSTIDTQWEQAVHGHDNHPLLILLPIQVP